MFWLGLILGMVIGCVISIVSFQKLMYYIGEHPEQMEQLVSDVVGKVATKITKDVLDQLNKKYESIPKRYKTNNPFMTNSIDIAAQNVIVNENKVYDI